MYQIIVEVDGHGIIKNYELFYINLINSFLHDKSVYNYYCNIEKSHMFLKV